MKVHKSNLDYELVAERTSCTGTYTRDCDYSSPEQCALGCRGASFMFTFGVEGNYSCAEGMCRCYCMLSSTEGSCVQKSQPAFNLYKITSSMPAPSTAVKPPSKYIYLSKVII